MNFVEKETEEVYEESLAQREQTNGASILSGPPSGAVDGFTYSRTENNPTNLQIAGVGFVVSVLATFVGITTSILTAVATLYVSITADQAWWKERYYFKNEVDGHKVNMTEKIQYNYYESSAYDDYINTVTTYQNITNYGGRGPIRTYP